MNWDDLRYVAAVARHGSLLRAARELEVQHTTVGRRIDAAERALRRKLFARGTAGLVLTTDGERLLEPLQRVEEAVSTLERQASAGRGEVEGTVRVTSPETFGVAWLAPRLAGLARQHPGLVLDLDPSGAMRDLGRREAEIAVRYARSRQPGIVVRRVAELGYGLYAARSYLARRPVRTARDLADHPLLTAPPDSPDAIWFAKLAREASSERGLAREASSARGLAREASSERGLAREASLAGGAQPVLTCALAGGLLAAAKAGTGIAVLPRYLGDPEPDLAYLPMPDAPTETLWIAVHRDLRKTPRVRTVLDHLIACFEREAAALRGRA